MLHPDAIHSREAVEPQNKLERDLYSGGNSDDNYRVAYVSKMFAVKTEELPENQRKQLTAEDMRARAKIAKEERERKAEMLAKGIEISAASTEKIEEDTPESEADKNRESLIGFARLYSGTIRVGETLYAVLPKYNAALGPTHPQNGRHLSSIKVEQLYMMMGRELVVVQEVQAGNLFAIAGLEGIVGRNATLCAMSSGAPVKELGERAADRDCLVNLAGITLTVSSSSPLPLDLLADFLFTPPSLLLSFVSLLSLPIPVSSFTLLFLSSSRS